MKLTLKNLSMAIMMSTIVMGSSAMAADSNEKIVIAHRGASGYLPEHTLPAKAMAYAQGADYLEQDLVMTKDDNLVVLHDHYLDRVTDVADRLPDRARKDGRYYAIDFTLDEIKSLKFTEGFDIENGKKVQTYPGVFFWVSPTSACTLKKRLNLFRVKSLYREKNIGIYPEIKAPWFHHQEGKDIAAKTLEVLKKYGYTGKDDKVYLQCFDADELKRVLRMSWNQNGHGAQSGTADCLYTDWNETQQKQPDGSWVNYNYDWMFAGCCETGGGICRWYWSGITIC